MVNTKTLEALKDNDGMTLKRFTPVTYKNGYQVGITGKETTNAREAVEIIKSFNGDCGVWYSNGIYYIDKSLHVNGKQVAIELGKACNQISILKWSDMSLIYC